MKKRELNYDILRAAAAALVVLAHVSAAFLETFIWDYWDGLPGNHPLYSVIYTTLGRFTVPVFFMLSGAFVLDGRKAENARTFYRKSWDAIGKTGAFAMAFGMLYSLFCSLVLDHTGIMPVLRGMMNGVPFYHLWYLPVLLGIYLLVPVIAKIRADVSDRDFRNISWFVLLAGCAALWLNPPVEMHWNIGESLCYAGYFMIGDVLRRDVKQKKGGLPLVIAGFLLEIGAAYLLYRSILAGNDRMLGEHRYILSYAPATVAASVLIFSGVSRMECRTDPGIFSRATFGIYLSHAFILDVILRVSRALYGQRWLTHLDARFAIPAVWVGVYLLSVGVSELLHRLRTAGK